MRRLVFGSARGPDGEPVLAAEQERADRVPAADSRLKMIEAFRTHVLSYGDRLQVLLKAPNMPSRRVPTVAELSV